MIVNTNGKRALLTLGAVALSVSMAVGQAPRKDDVGEETLAPGQVLGVVGRHVQDTDGADAGRLWDVLIDSNGEPRAVVIDYGGVLGMAGARSPLHGMQSGSHPVILRVLFA